MNIFGYRFHLVLLIVLIGSGCHNRDCEWTEIWNPFNSDYDIDIDCLIESGLVLDFHEHPSLLGSRGDVNVQYWLSGKGYREVEEIQDDVVITAGEFFISMEALTDEAVRNKIREFNAVCVSDIGIGADSVDFFVKHRINRIIFKCELDYSKSGIVVPVSRPLVRLDEREERKDNLRKHSLK